MSKFSKKLRSVMVAAAMASSVAVTVPASAATIQLGFILDGSGSIGAGNWSTIVNGLSSAINTLIPVGGADTYEISVVSFSTASATTINIANFLVTDATSRTNLANQIAALPYQNGGATNYAAAFAAMLDALDNTIGRAAFSYVNFATDGAQNQGGTGVAERNALIAAGVDNISIEGIGSGIDAADLQSNFCYPGPCDATSPYNFPTQGFYIGVANAAGYAQAIGNKIVTITKVPEPGTLALLGISVLGMFGLRRRQAA